MRPHARASAAFPIALAVSLAFATHVFAEPLGRITHVFASGGATVIVRSDPGAGYAIDGSVARFSAVYSTMTSPGGKSIAVLGDVKGGALAWCARGSVTPPLGSWSAAWSPDGATFAVADVAEDGAATLWKNGVAEIRGGADYRIGYLPSGAFWETWGAPGERYCALDGRRSGPWKLLSPWPAPSPDGRVAVFSAKNASDGTLLIVDGTPTETYASLEFLGFAADGRTPISAAIKDGPKDMTLSVGSLGPIPVATAEDARWPLASPLGHAACAIKAEGSDEAVVIVESRGRIGPFERLLDLRYETVPGGKGAADDALCALVAGADRVVRLVGVGPRGAFDSGPLEGMAFAEWGLSPDGTMVSYFDKDGLVRDRPLDRTSPGRKVKGAEAWTGFLDLDDALRGAYSYRDETGGKRLVSAGRDEGPFDEIGFPGLGGDDSPEALKRAWARELAGAPIAYVARDKGSREFRVRQAGKSYGPYDFARLLGRRRSDSAPVYAAAAKDGFSVYAGADRIAGPVAGDVEIVESSMPAGGMTAWRYVQLRDASGAWKATVALDGVTLVGVATADAAGGIAFTKR